MQERRLSTETLEERLLTKSYSRHILFVILLLMIISFYFFQNKIKPSFNIVISQNHTILPSTLSEPKLTSELNTIRCIVYVKKCAGRFGNHMFIVASAYGLARLHSCHLYFTQEVLNAIRKVFISDFSSLLLSSSAFNTIINVNINPMTKTSKEVGCQYIPELTRPNAISKGQIFELTGYWQSYLHFIKYANDLRQNIFISTQPILKKISYFFRNIYQQKFRFQPDFASHNHHLFKQELTYSNQSTWIGIHIRRSDFVHLKYSSPNTYLFTAIKYYSEHYSNAHFIVASDDKPYCQNLFRNYSNIFITPNSFSIGEDLITLSLCQHSIVTGGTFGWWSAFLANGQVIHDTTYASGCNKREHYYPPWFLIDGYVRAHKNTNYTL